ncbi:MAG: carbonic anhydrase [Candidatus Acidiferrales bacterium]
MTTPPLLARIKPAIAETVFEGEKSSKYPDYVDAVAARTNVKLAIENLRRRSPIFADLEEKKGAIQLAGAMYNLADGVADFVSQRV